MSKLRRTSAKTISWRTLGTVDTILISYFVTGSVAMAGAIGSIEIFTKMALYFIHERVWDKIGWGK